jgi:hypothetical protein
MLFFLGYTEEIINCQNLAKNNQKVQEKVTDSVVYSTAVLCGGYEVHTREEILI